MSKRFDIFLNAFTAGVPDGAPAVAYQSLVGSSAAFAAAALAVKTGGVVVAIASGLPEADVLFSDLESIADEAGVRALEFPPEIEDDRGTAAARLKVSAALGAYSIRPYPLVIVAPVMALKDGVATSDQVQSASLTLALAGYDGSGIGFAEVQAKLLAGGYERAVEVSSPGEFSVRGGVLDAWSPGDERPVRAEFFGDELDTMGYFDPESQRRTENIDTTVILPVEESQPMLHPAGIHGLCRDIRSLIARQKRRKNIHEPLVQTLEKDLEKYENGISNTASDRYMALIYPEMATALDYIPQDTAVIVCDQSGLHRTARTRCDQVGMQLDSLLQGGQVAGELCDYVCQWEDLCGFLSGRCTVYLDSFGGSSLA